MPITTTQLIAIGKTIGLPVAGAIGMHLWSRYRGRMAVIRWTQRITALGFASEDTGWGEVRLLYDGDPANSLHMCNVEVQNASSRDLSNVVVTIVANDGTVSLRGAGRLRGGATQFSLSEAYMKALNGIEGKELPDSERALLLPRMEFMIPVLNRGAVADFSVLLARHDHATPSVSLSIEHVGVRATQEELDTLTWGVRDTQASMVGLLISASVGTTAVVLRWPPWLIAAVVWTTAILCLYTGAATVRFWRWVSALAD